MTNLLEALALISKPSESDVAEWLSSAESSVEFLKENVQSDRIILYASMPCVVIHAVLAPLKHLDPPDQKELSGQFVQLDNTWFIEHEMGGGERDRVYLSPPMHSLGKTLSEGEKLIFRRFFADSSEHPIELSQKLVHTLDLHFIPERSAYCRLNEDGDVVDVINVVDEWGGDWANHRSVVTIMANDLSEYMCLTEMGMVLFFDFTRTQRESFQGWSDDHERFERIER